MRKKVSRLLLYVALCTVCAVTKAQNVSKSFENQSLKSVLTEIEYQTGLSIIYELKEVDETKKITGYFKNTPVEQVLSEILDKDLTFTIRNKMILLSKRKNENRQQEGVKRVTGKVIDEKGEAVIGATVLVKGTTNGTITDVDGIFTLDNVPSDALIAISYIGYQDRELSVKDKQSVNVTLSEDSKQLDEVVVVGYGSVKKRDLTGSVASLNAETISAVPATTAAEALQGRASGVVVSTSNWSPGSSPSVLIRGKRSINASNDPLFVIDGIPVTGGMGEISPADIESMEVLKDASATAIYGSRGSNGGILITTKQGKEGRRPGESRGGHKISLRIFS